MPEVAGDAACLVDPYSSDSIRQGIIKVINDEAYRESLIQKGYVNVKNFNPETIALQYLDLYKKVANRN
jgi:glycosyltransferase involved in cell wall biosynthesis